MTKYWVLFTLFFHIKGPTFKHDQNGYGGFKNLVIFTFNPSKPFKPKHFLWTMKKTLTGLSKVTALHYILPVTFFDAHDEITKLLWDCCRARSHMTSHKDLQINALCFPLASGILGTRPLDHVCLCVPYRKISHHFYCYEGKKPYSSTTEFIHNSTFMNSYSELDLNLKTWGSFIP